jgi:hypothetical protein
MELDGTGVKVVYGAGTLWTDLPPVYNNDQLAAVAAASLRGRGYGVDGGGRALMEPGEVRGRRGGVRWVQEAVVGWRITPSSVRLMVRVDPWGHEDESRAIVRDALGRLGYGPGDGGAMARAAAGAGDEPDAGRAEALFERFETPGLPGGAGISTRP